MSLGDSCGDSGVPGHGAPTPGPGKEARRGSITSPPGPVGARGPPKLPRRGICTGEMPPKLGEVLVATARRALPRPWPAIPPSGATGEPSSRGLRGGSPPRPWYTGMPDTLQGMSQTHSPSQTAAVSRGHGSVPSHSLTLPLRALPPLLLVLLLLTTLFWVTERRACALGEARAETVVRGPDWPSAPHVPLPWTRRPPDHAPPSRPPSTRNAADRRPGRLF